jgi:hypothetical protein
MERNGYSFEDALRYVKSRRNIVRPNEGFKRQLIDLEYELKKKNST